MRRRVLEISFVLVIMALTLYFVNDREVSELVSEESSSAMVEATASPRLYRQRIGKGHILVEDDIDAGDLTDYENAGCGPQPEPPDFHNPPPFTPEMRLRGRELYQANCASCHGEAGKGDGDTGLYFDPSPTDLTAPKAYKQGNRPEVVAFTTYYGIDDTAMAPWGDILNSKEIWAIAAYIELDVLKRKAVSRRQGPVDTGFRVKRITASVLADNESDDDKAAIAGFVRRTYSVEPTPAQTP